MNGAKFSRTSIIMGFITAEKWSGWEIYARLSRNSLISHSNKENMGRMKFPGPCFYLYSKSSVSRIS
ncbi:hypothetical protein BZL31_25080 [Escherichia coli]|nr:hypothetical protein BZL31_25080 [Escherichia coli]